MHLLVLGEGKNDLGTKNQDASVVQMGAIPILVERLLSEVVSDRKIEFHVCEWKNIRTFPSRSGRAIGFKAKLQAVAKLPLGRQCDAIVGVVDRDGARNQSRLKQLQEGKESLERDGKRCAVGLAIESLEAWMLADEQALRDALDNNTIQRQPDPESLISKDEKSDRNPKGRLQRLINQSIPTNTGKSKYSVSYAAIAQRAALDVLGERCPKGFRPFAVQVRGLWGS